MPFIAYDFSKPDRARGIAVREVLTYAVGWRKTIVGWVNLRLIDGSDPNVVNLAPQHFFDFVPEAMSDAVSGVVYLSADQGGGARVHACTRGGNRMTRRRSLRIHLRHLLMLIKSGEVSR